MESALGNLRWGLVEAAALPDQVASLQADRDEIQAVCQLRDQVSAVEADDEYAGMQDRVAELEPCRDRFVEAIGGRDGSR